MDHFAGLDVSVKDTNVCRHSRVSGNGANTTISCSSAQADTRIYDLFV